jgi:aspartokinase
MRNNPIIVQKYGGACLETPAKICAVASSLADLHSRGHRVVVIVSAMGKTTDELVKMAYQVSPHPNRRELDMLLTTGERISMSLMSMALSDLGVPATSFTGSQAGVMTDAFLRANLICAAHSRARRTRSRAHRGFSGLSGRESGDQRNHHAGPGWQRHHCGRHGRGAKSRVL